MVNVEPIAIHCTRRSGPIQLPTEASWLRGGPGIANLRARGASRL